jgi:predicted RND superfamily exporter protein
MTTEQFDQQDFQEKSNLLFGRLGLWIARHRWLVLLVFIASLIGASIFAALVRTDNSFEAYFDSKDTTYNYYTNYKLDFGSDEVTYLLYKAPNAEHGPFDLEVMQKILSLTEALETEVPFVEEVTSLTNVEIMEAEDDFLNIHEMAIDFPETQEQMLQLKKLFMTKPVYINGLISPDATHAGIIIEMSRTSSDPIESLRADPAAGDAIDNLYPQASYNSISAILARPEYQGIEFYRTGDVPLNNAYNVIITEEAGLLTGLSLLLIAVISLVFFRRSWIGFLAPLIIVILGLIVTIGFMGLVGYDMGIMFLVVPTMITAIGVAQTVHLISEHKHYQQLGYDNNTIIRKTLEHVGLPCLLAAITTSIGFLGMSSSNLKAIADLSVYLGVGVFLTFLISMAVMILIMAFQKNTPSTSDTPTNTTNIDTDTDTEASVTDGFSTLLNWINHINLKRPTVVLVISSLVFLLSLSGINQLKIGFNFLTEFKPHTIVRSETTYVQSIMGGMSNLVFIFDSGKTDGIKDYTLLKDLERLQLKAEESPLIKKTYSIVDILKDLNQTLHNNDPDFYTLPEDNALIAQYLLMYEISGGEELEDYITGDYARTVLELRLTSAESYLVRDMVEELQSFIDNELTTNTDAISKTGIGALWLKMGEYIAESQIIGYAFTFSIITLILCLVFRSIKVGLIAMIPNILPIVVVLGVMGWADMHLDYMRLLLATVAIGIAVDDTVHMMSRFRREFYRLGNYEAAMQASILGVGRALIITSVILTLSFSIFLASDMAVLASFGILLSVTIIAALIADLFLMPVLLLKLKPFGPEK